MTDVAVVDYGMGNLRSVAKAIERVAPRLQVAITSDPEAVARERVTQHRHDVLVVVHHQHVGRGFQGSSWGTPGSEPIKTPSAAKAARYLA